jgi:cell division transport system ATP-binding protein
MFGHDRIIELRKATIYNGEFPILNNLNFELVSAEFCYVVGKSGSGKTTLLKALYGEIPVHSGFAHVLGIDLRTLKVKNIPFLRRKIGMVFQDFALIQKWTVQENLDFVLRATDWKDLQERMHRIEEVLNKVDLYHKIDKKIYTLSGGEQQRVALARSILNRPQLLFADEPTGSLDPYTSDALLYLISDLASEYKLSVLFATHDQRILDKFPARVFECNAGSLIEIG